MGLLLELNSMVDLVQRNLSIEHSLESNFSICNVNSNKAGSTRIFMSSAKEIFFSPERILIIKCARLRAAG
jgi:hypothetical protein